MPSAHDARPRYLVPIVAAVVLIVASGCGGTSSTSAATETSPVARADNPAKASASLREESRVVIPLDIAAPDSIAVTETGVALAVAAGNTSSIYWADFHDRSVRQVKGVRGVVVDVAATSDWLVWVEQERTQSDALEPVHWRIVARNSHTEALTTLARSRHRTALPPGILLEGSTLFTSRYLGLASGRWDLDATDLERGTTTTLRRRIAAAQFVRRGADLIAAVTTDRGSGPDEMKSDLFNVATTPPTRITTSGQAVGFDMVGDTLMWQECTFENECSVYSLKWPGGTPFLELTATDPLPTLGEGFFTVTQGPGGYDDPAVTPVGPASDVLPLAEPPGEHMSGVIATAGKLVAWTTYRGEDSDRAASLVVVRLAVD